MKAYRARKDSGPSMNAVMDSIHTVNVSALEEMDKCNMHIFINLMYEVNIKQEFSFIEILQFFFCYMDYVNMENVFVKQFSLNIISYIWIYVNTKKGEFFSTKQIYSCFARLTF